MTFSLGDDEEDIPSMEDVWVRLIALHMMDFSWLHGIDLTPPDGGPETVGPAEYKRGTE